MRMVSCAACCGAGSKACLRAASCRRLADFRIKPSAAATFGGILFFLGYLAAWTPLAWSASFGGIPLPPTEVRFTAPATLALLFCIVNAFFEELFVLGYNMTAMEEQPAPAAITFSVFVRSLYHLYQGPVGAVMILLFGLAAGVVYRKWRTLWPVIVGHVFLDIVGVFLRR